jgi:hypothetical protein
MLEAQHVAVKADGAVEVRDQGGRTGFKLNQGRSLLDLGEY